MPELREFDRYMTHLSAGLGHADRHAGLRGCLRNEWHPRETPKRAQSRRKAQAGRGPDEHLQRPVGPFWGLTVRAGRPRVPGGVAPLARATSPGRTTRLPQRPGPLRRGCHSFRKHPLRGYCAGLMAPLKRNSVEPMAAHLAPAARRSRHQSLHHFVADAAWSDEQMLLRVAQWVVPAMDFSDGGWWIIDDTGFPKQGRHSVGVARQYCGMLGKQDNCQVAVSVTLACQAGSLPVAWQLYLPEEWADHAPRREKAGVPQGLEFATKPAIALAQIEQLVEQGAPKHCVLADAGYGVDTAFRERLSELGLAYVVGVTGQVAVWPPGHKALPTAPSSGRGVVPTRQRLGDATQQRPQSIKALAFELAPSQWQTVE